MMETDRSPDSVRLLGLLQRMLNVYDSGPDDRRDLDLRLYEPEGEAVRNKLGAC